MFIVVYHDFLYHDQVIQESVYAQQTKFIAYDFGFLGF